MLNQDICWLSVGNRAERGKILYQKNIRKIMCRNIRQISKRYCAEISAKQYQTNIRKILRSNIRQIWDIPSEKIGQNIHPPEICFIVVNYQHWTGTSAFRPFLAPLDHWGGLGGPG